MTALALVNSYMTARNRTKSNYILHIMAYNTSVKINENLDSVDATLGIKKFDVIKADKDLIKAPYPPKNFFIYLLNIHSCWLLPCVLHPLRE